MITIISATPKCISRIVDIHSKAFPNFFLTSLGTSFLRLYYLSVLKHSQGLLLICVKDNGEIVGFCAGTILSASFNKRLVKSNFVAYAKQGFKLLFTNPVSLWHLYKNMSKEVGEVGDKGEYAELLSIAVDPNVQRTGAGKKLLLALEVEAKKRGSRQMSLTTDYYNNEKAVSFYYSLGYKNWYDFVTYPHRKMYRLIKTL